MNIIAQKQIELREKLTKYLEQFNEDIGSDGKPFTPKQGFIDEFDNIIDKFKTTEEFFEFEKSDDPMTVDWTFGQLDRNMPIEEFAFEFVIFWVDNAVKGELLKRRDSE